LDRRLVAIFLLLFVLYFTGSRFCLDGYELEYVLSAMNVYHGNGPAMASGFKSCPGIADTTGDKPLYPRQNLLQTFLSVPFYAAGALLFGEKPTIPDQGNFWEIPWGPVVAVSLLNPLLAALTAILIAMTALHLGVSKPDHYYLAILFGITTMIWHYAGIGMEIVQTATLAAAVFAVIRFRFTGKWSMLCLALVMIVALPNCKKHTVVFVIPLLIYLIWSIVQQYPQKANRIIIAVGTISILGTIVMIYSMLMRFHQNPGLFPYLLRSFSIGGFKSIDLIFGLTLSPGEGILIFNPMLWFAIPAFGGFYKKFKPEALLFTGLAGVLLIVLWKVPYILIDEEWGPRYLLVLLPLIFLAGASGLLKRRAGLMKNIFIIILILSILINWVSSLYLGFKVLDTALAAGVSDYFILVFTPSMSQIWLSFECLYSYISWFFTGYHQELVYRSYSNYTGIGGHFETLHQDLNHFDNPSGGIFLLRWVLSELGIHFITPKLATLIKLLTDIVLLGIAILFFRKYFLKSTEPV